MLADLCCLFFNDTATTEIYTLSLHDALPIFFVPQGEFISYAALSLAFLQAGRVPGVVYVLVGGGLVADRKSTRLNSSHANISYAVFCLKKHYLNAQAALTYPDIAGDPVLYGN